MSPPSSPLASLYERALAAHGRGDLTTAERLYRRILAEDPAYASALHYLGAIVIARGQLQEALPILQHSLRLEPFDGYFHYNYALLLRMLGQDAVARRHLLTAIVHEPLLLDAYYHFGIILLAEHAYPAAARTFRRARGLSEIRDVCDENLFYLQVFHTRELAVRQPANWAQPPLVSIVIPCVNYGQFIVDAVNSCLAQTYRNIEIIVVEGGSTDGRTRQIVEALQHPKLRTVFRSPIRPVGDNRNFGIGIARGAFICCLDADDKLAPDYIEKALFCLHEFGYDVAGSGVQTFGATETRRNFIRQPTLNDFQQANQLSTAALFRRVWWEKAGGFYDYDRANGFVHEDWNFWFRLAALGARMMNINWEHLILYRQHGFERLTGKSTLLPLDQQLARIRQHNADALTRRNNTNAPASPHRS